MRVCAHPSSPAGCARADTRPVCSRAAQRPPATSLATRPSRASCRRRAQRPISRRGGGGAGARQPQHHRFAAEPRLSPRPYRRRHLVDPAAPWRGRRRRGQGGRAGGRGARHRAPGGHRSCRSRLPGRAALGGRPEAWAAAGLPVAASPAESGGCATHRFLFFTAKRHAGTAEAAEAARQYLAWEVGLIDQLDAQERGAFRIA